MDEAGDLALFDRKGKVIVGEPGVSKFFMVGVARISDPQTINDALEELRTL